MEEPEAMRRRWDDRYRGADRPGAPARVVAENLHLLPASGRALEVACGLGANALLLARQGLEVEAWDLSPVAIGALRRFAGDAGLDLVARERDVVARPPEAGAWDVVVVTRFLERSLAPALMAALRPGGLLFYQTFTRERCSDEGPSSDAWRLARGELLELFAPLRLLVYREEGRVGDCARGFRNQALLVARREP
ncbi:MAG TPA: methyltransferase domain-containing protein [Gammaproteobacteria bacterium]|nr:methyltransferase domain-containing protein [Gammaproteobacteria bacterium]